MTGIVKEIPVNLIEVGDYNPRKFFDPQYIKELADSIKRDGQWNPIIVNQNSQGYDLIAGECRLRAVKSLEHDKIMARILNIDDDEARLLALKTNVLRRDMNPIEEGDGIKKLIERDWSVKEISKNLNKSQPWVYYRLNLFENGTEGIKNAVIKKIIPLMHAVKISEISEGLQGPATEKAIKERLNLKETSGLVNLLRDARTEKEIQQAFTTSRGKLSAFANRNLNLTSPIEGEEIEDNSKDQISIVECICGVKYIFDWDKQQLVKVHSPKAVNLLNHL